jgi:small basic protein
LRYIGDEEILQEVKTDLKETYYPNVFAGGMFFIILIASVIAVSIGEVIDRFLPAKWQWTGIGLVDST